MSTDQLQTNNLGTENIKLKTARHIFERLEDRYQNHPYFKINEFSIIEDELEYISNMGFLTENLFPPDSMNSYIKQVLPRFVRHSFDEQKTNLGILLYNLKLLLNYGPLLTKDFKFNFELIIVHALNLWTTKYPIKFENIRQIIEVVLRGFSTPSLRISPHQKRPWISRPCTLKHIVRHKIRIVVRNPVHILKLELPNFLNTYLRYQE